MDNKPQYIVEYRYPKWFVLSLIAFGLTVVFLTSFMWETYRQYRMGCYQLLSPSVYDSPVQ